MSTIHSKRVWYSWSCPLPLTGFGITKKDSKPETVLKYISVTVIFNRDFEPGLRQAIHLCPQETETHITQQNFKVSKIL